ncbi:MAG: DUF1501 domain-containing protein [Planctomycetes bacterium]|nr:DUF1501 domain-containing protein [Planctomycetota bacterium]
MNHRKIPAVPLTRRDALGRIGSGFGMVAFAALMNQSLARAAERFAQDGSPRPFDHPPKANAVIFLVMNGGLSQVDSFDPKPMLDKHHGEPLPGGEVATERKTGALMRSPFKFQRYGQCGRPVSELFPHVGSCADDLCFVHSMHTDIPNHEPSLLMLNTGHTQVGRPSMGSWLTYGLGSSNQNLPGFVVLCPDVPTTVGPPMWNNAFLPAIHQGTFISDRVEKQTAEELIGKEFDPKQLVRNLRNEKFSLAEQRRELDLLIELERARRERERTRDPELEAAIQSMEVAYRMQTEALDVFDLRKETKATLDLYGRGSTARGCLLAVRLVERGVRMVQVYYAKRDPWDHHDNILNHRDTARDSDQPFAAVIKDLKSRGLFEKTLVVCGSEFGRTPVVEVGSNGGSTQSGRDHNPFGFTMWLAGGGIKGGMAHGATDDFGFKAVEKPVHVHDLQATILHLLGIDHTRLTYRYSGRDFRLTDVSGVVQHEWIA